MVQIADNRTLMKLWRLDANPQPEKDTTVRQSVTIPAQLAREVRRVAKERNVTMSRTLVALAERV